MDKFLTYVCKECGKPPKQKIIHSMPSVGGEYKNMYNLHSERKWLIETKEGNLMGICSGNEELCEFDIIDDTYLVQIPSILKLKAEIDKLPDVPFNPKNLWKYRFNKKKLNKNEY